MYYLHWSGNAGLRQQHRDSSAMTQRQSFPRGSGILLHISSLPSPYGIGDLGPDAYRFADALSAAGQTYWQVLPLNPTDPAAGESPYYSSSAFAGNPLLVSPAGLVEKGLLDSSDISAPPALPDRRAAFKGVRAYKDGLLDKAYDRFVSSAPPEIYGRFCAAESWWLDDYILFAALRQAHPRRSWTDWPAALRDRSPDELARARAELGGAIERIRFRQFLFFDQWRSLRAHCAAKGLKIVGDVPIYVSLESADVWAHPQVFRLGADRRPSVVSGVPPDYFSATGQLWNNPVYDWDFLQKSRYAWWVARMRATLERFDIVRIDHFRGLVQYWEIPAGSTTAVTGSWHDVPTNDFLDTLTKEFPSFPVIAEDLGTITPDVREAMARYGLPGMKVLLFAFDDDNGRNPYLPHNYERNAVVYTGTHDNNTFRGWLRGEASEEQRRRLYAFLGRRPAAAEAAWELVRTAMLSVADVCIVPLQDYLCLDSRARMNRPAQPRGNWVWRCTPQEMAGVDWKRIAAMTRAAGRMPPAAGA